MADSLFGTDGGELLHGPSIDATGDDFGDLCDRYGLLLINRFKRDEFSRETLVYANGDRTVQMTAEPYWDAAVGSTYSLTVTKRS